MSWEKAGMCATRILEQVHTELNLGDQRTNTEGLSFDRPAGCKGIEVARWTALAMFDHDLLTPTLAVPTLVDFIPTYLEDNAGRWRFSPA